MLKVYFDGSKSERSESLTLAAVAADESLWADFNDQWRTVLSRRGSAPYSHMAESMKLEGAFRGWKPATRDFLLSGLGDLLAEFSHKERCMAFSCTVDLGAHSRLKQSRNLPSPERLCARLIFPKIMDWYGTFPEAILDQMEVFFDRNEGFMRHISTDWNDKRVRRKYPIWNLIKTIAPATMQNTPPLQGADMIAWARNRLATTPPLSPLELKPELSVTDNFSLRAKLIFASTRIFYWTVDEHAMLTRRFPEGETID